MNTFIARLLSYFNSSPTHFEIIDKPTEKSRSLCLQNGKEYDHEVIYMFSIIDENGRRWQLHSETNCVFIYAIQPKYVKLTVMDRYASRGLLDYYRWTKI